LTSIERVALSFCLQHLESKGDGPTARRAEELRAGIDAEQDMGTAIAADEIPAFIEDIKPGMSGESLDKVLSTMIKLLPEREQARINSDDKMRNAEIAKFNADSVAVDPLDAVIANQKVLSGRVEAMLSAEIEKGKAPIDDVQV
jgi:hypothetical protein